ncbi:hypothetical protein BU16DRAFT_339745 [Lophium mytilinum]|uniref:Uncharacterized protein n=1 Tax=Lophium mytilinum TaxID=390894 RepID=A0A6A6QX88_9PEZI|nr:hypothetical protein BU16DRAFT_339745 [Lophium mytilinum]
MGKFEFEFPHLTSRFSKRDPVTGKSTCTLFVLCLVKTTEEQRTSILEELNAIDHEWEGRPNVDPRPMEVVPWIRNYDPPVSIVFDISEHRQISAIFVDAQTLRDNTVIITNSFKSSPIDHWWSGELEAARVPARRANLTISDIWLRQISLFPQHVPEECRVLRPHKPDEGWEVVSKLNAVQWDFPTHLPPNMKLSASSTVLISLIHLSDAEIEALKSEIGSDPLLEPVQIYNWPKDAVPASRVDMWRIFDQVKQEFPAPYEQVFGFFIDCTHLHGLDRKPEVIVVDRRRASLDEASIVGEPYPVFLLGPTTEYQIRAVRDVLMNEEGEFQFITVPNGDGTLESLVRYFESAEFRHYEEPPHIFIAVDEETLSTLPDQEEDDTEKWNPGDCSVIVASANGCTTRSPSYSVTEFLGYGYGRTSLDDYGPTSAMNNLNTANMDLWELIEPDDDCEKDEYGQCKPKRVFWSTFTPGDAVLDH